MSRSSLAANVACIVLLTSLLLPLLPGAAGQTAPSPPSAGPAISLSKADLALAEGGATGSYTVTLSQPSPTEVVVTIGGLGSDLTANPATLTFPAGPLTPQTVVLTATDDAVVEGSETIAVVHTAASTDPTYNGKTASLPTTVTDNDVGVVILHAGTDAASTVVSEAGTQDTIRVALGRAPTSNVKVTLTPDPQLSLNLLTVTFTPANWQTPRDLALGAAQDQIAQGTRSKDINAAVTTTSDPAYTGKSATLSATIQDNDVAGYVFNALARNALPTLAFAEGGAASFTLKLTSQPVAAVTVNLAGTNGAVTVPSTLTFTSANWQAAQTVSVQRPQDQIDQATATTYTVTATLATSTSDASYATIPGPVVATITDDDVGAVLLSHTGGSTSANENGATDTFGARLATQPQAAVTLALTGPSGLTLSPSSLTFDATSWETVQSVTVAAVADTTAELPQSGTLTATASSAADPVYPGKTATLPVTILDDDGVLVVVESGGSTADAEGGGTDSFTVQLIGNPSSAVNVRLTASDGTQFQVNGATVEDLTFDPKAEGRPALPCSSNGPGQTSSCSWDAPQTVQVAAVADNVVDGTRTGTITLRATSPDAAYNNQVSRPVAVTALDSDVAGFVFDGAAVGVLPALALTEGTSSDTYTVRLSSIPSGPVTVALTGVGGAVPTPASLTFTTASWNTAQTVTVNVPRDNVDQGASYAASVAHAITSSGDPMYASVPGPLPITVTDHSDDIAGWHFVAASGGAELARGTLPAAFTAPEGGQAVYKVRPHTKPISPVTVTLTGTGGSVPSPATLTFTAADWGTAQSVTVSFPQNDVDQASNYPAPVQQSAASSDPLYATIPGPIPFTVTDDDVANLRLLGTGASTAVTEGGPGEADTVEVALATQPTAAVTVTLTPPADVTLSAASLSFTPANWNVAQVVTVTAVDDEEAEITETPNLSAAAASADALYAGKSATLALTILDDDGVLIVQRTGADTSVQEGGATDTYTVQLVANPTSQVRVTVSSPGGQLRFNGSATFQLTFEPSSSTALLPARCPNDPTKNCQWDHPQEVTVSALDDAVPEGTVAALIQHALASTDSRFNGVPSAGLQAIVADNDAGVFIVESGTGTAVAEGGAGDSYTVALSTAPTFSVAVVVQAPGRVVTNPGTLFFDAESWNVPQTVAVSAAPDDVDQDGVDTYTLTHEVSSVDAAYNGLLAPSVTVAVTDDDTAGFSAIPTEGSNVVTEGGAGDSFGFRLRTQPTAPVTVTLSEDAQSTIIPTTLTFTPSNWWQPQSVAVTAVDDAAREGTHSTYVSFTLASDDPKYQGLANFLRITVIDND